MSILIILALGTIVDAIVNDLEAVAHAWKRTHNKEIRRKGRNQHVYYL